jgi:hypothetical protein
VIETEKSVSNPILRDRAGFPVITQAGGRNSATLLWHVPPIFRHPGLRRVGRVIRVVGFILLALGAALIAAGCAVEFSRHGWAGLRELLTPFEIGNVLAVVLTLAPGLALVWIGDFLIGRERAAERPRYRV